MAYVMPLEQAEEKILLKRSCCTDGDNVTLEERECLL